MQCRSATRPKNQTYPIIPSVNFKTENQYNKNPVFCVRVYPPDSNHIKAASWFVNLVMVLCQPSYVKAKIPEDTTAKTKVSIVFFFPSTTTYICILTLFSTGNYYDILPLPLPSFWCKENPSSLCTTDISGSVM